MLPPPEITGADLGVAVSAPSSSANQQWQDTLRVTNAGPGSATSAQLLAIIPEGATLYASTPPAGWQCSETSLDTVLQLLTCNDSNTLLASASTTFGLELEAVGKSASTDPSSYQLQTAVQSSATDSNASNDSASAATTYTGSLTPADQVAVDTTTTTLAGCGQDSPGTDIVQIGDPTIGGAGPAFRHGRASFIAPQPGIPAGPAVPGGISGAGAAAGGAAGTGAAGIAAGALAGVTAGATAAAQVGEAVAGATAQITEGGSGCGTTAAAARVQHSAGTAPGARTAVAKAPRQVKCVPAGGGLRCDLGKIPAHMPIHVTLTLPWSHQVAGENLTLPTSIASTHAGKTRTIASKRVRVHVASRTIVQVAFRPSTINAKHGDYADSVEIHNIGILPLSTNSLCVALPTGAKLLTASGGSRHGQQACWPVKGLAPGREVTESMSFTPTYAGGKRPTPIFPVSTAKKSK